MPATKNKECKKAIRFISNGIKNYEHPESLSRWCKLAKTKVGYDKSSNAFRFIITKRLDRIEYLRGYSLMEKCAVELNDERKITYFRSPNGDCVLQSEQDPNPHTRRFEGKHVRDKHCEKAIKFISDSIKNYTKPQSLEGWCELAKTEVGYDKSAHSFSSVIRKRLDNVEDLKGYSLNEKVQLVFIFRRPVSPGFLKLLKDAKCIAKLDDSSKITYFRSEDRHIVLQLEHKKTAGIQVKTPHNVQAQSPRSSPQSLPDSPEIDDMEMGNEENEEAQEQEKQENEAPEKKKKENRDISPKQNSILNTEEDVDVATESIQQEAPFDGSIDYDDLDHGEYPEFMVPNEIEPPMQHNKRHQTPSQENPKRRKIDKPEETEVANSPEINDVEKTRNEEGEEAPEHILEDSEEPTCRVNNESDNQSQVAEKEIDAALEQKPETFDDVGPTVNESLNIQNQNSQARNHENNQNGVKIEDSQEETEQEPEAWVPEAKAEIPALETMSLLKLTEQIEVLAFNINLDKSFQQKALRAVRLFEANDQLITIQDFNQLFKIVLKNLKSGRLQNPTGSSMKLIRLFEHFKRSLIRPLGGGLMVDALAILEEEIRKLGESEDEIPVKTIQTKLDSLMHLLTNTWADLDE
ncbi:hypothetical protein B9Z55_027822 [Caenorhabditis nigoni]|uniref:SPK domain-containing protein n=1 Tax=Caenorhabditis nigoni TaxID=1611254 RepID=A0A2G5SEL4_9PELO|nr:hypothetical protein B9Z55_027822 [Caenorhabditis nigoni]